MTAREPANHTKPAFGRRALRMLLRSVSALAVLALLAISVETLLTQRDDRRHPPPGVFIDLADGRRLHAQVAGSERPGPTVVFEAGAGSFSPQWAWVQRQVADFAPTVAYDRPGLGWSDPYPSAWDASSVAADLFSALERLEVPKPYILVGHSLGATYARVFAHNHPDSVAGLVLVDPGHEDQFHLLEGAGDLTGLRAMHVASRVGLLRLTRPFDDIGATMPADEFVSWTARSYTVANTRGFLEEGKTVLRSIAPDVQVMDTDVGDRPVTVLRAADAEWPDTDAMRALQAQLTDISTQGQLIDVAHADHYSIVADPAHASTVTEAIDDMRSQIR